MDSDRTRKLKAFEFLCDNRLGVLSTISGNKPQAALIYYVVEDKNVYLITVNNSRKLLNIQKDPNISFVVANEFPPIEIQLEGTAEIVNDPDKKAHISSLYLEKVNKNPQSMNWPPLLKIPHLNGFAFMKMTINWFKFSDFRETEAKIVEGVLADWI